MHYPILLDMDRRQKILFITEDRTRGLYEIDRFFAYFFYAAETYKEIYPTGLLLSAAKMPHEFFLHTEQLGTIKLSLTPIDLGAPGKSNFRRFGCSLLGPKNKL